MNERDIKDIWFALSDYIDMRRTFTSGMEAMEENEHSLTIDETVKLILELEKEYPYLSDPYDYGN
jgi:hypothetical protein